MSGTQVSSFGNASQNALFDPMMAGKQQEQQNQLIGQQQTIASNNVAQVQQAAAGLLSAYPDEASRAAAYPRVVSFLQSQGFAMNASKEYPGEGVLRSLVNQGIPAKDLYSSGALMTPAQQALLSGNPGTSGQPPPGTTATPAFAAPTGAGTATIGQRQNNPGNLTFAGQPNATPGQGNRFAAFPDMPTGVAANADQLALYATQHGVNTVRDAVTRWVGDPKADLGSYIGDISKALGVGPDDKIDLTDPAVQAKFIQAQFPHESAGGGYVLNPADVAKGVQIATWRPTSPDRSCSRRQWPRLRRPQHPLEVSQRAPAARTPLVLEPAQPRRHWRLRRAVQGRRRLRGSNTTIKSCKAHRRGTILGYLPNGTAVLAGPVETHVGITGWNADGTPIRGGAPGAKRHAPSSCRGPGTARPAASSHTRAATACSSAGRSQPLAPAGRLHDPDRPELGALQAGDAKLPAERPCNTMRWPALTRRSPSGRLT